MGFDMATKTQILAAVVLLAGCSGSGSNADGSGETTDPSADGGPDGGPGADSLGGTSAVTASGTTDPDDDGPIPPSPVNLDLGGIPDAGEPLCGNGGSGKVEYSYIWIANSSQDTVSKINTVTLVEEGRYMTRDTPFGNPSRTSVSLNGDVAVANREGGLTKFYANPENCEDQNGNGVIETSSGANDILQWDDEECRAWYVPFNYTSQRPVAWTSGEWSAQSCSFENEKVWTTGVIADTTIEVNLVDGASGVIEDSVQVPEVNPGYFGFYGGAVDTEGNLWASQLGGGQLIRVDIDTLDYDLWTAPYGGYGMTVGASGYVFTCDWQVGRFDPATETWDGAQVNGGGGCMEDANGILWMANSPLVGVDVETLTPVYSYPLPQYVHGVSIDFQGNIWGVSMSSEAYRVDPSTGTFDTVTGLVNPYTYSDMTGFALDAVGGGGAPSG